MALIALERTSHNPFVASPADLVSPLLAEPLDLPPLAVVAGFAIDVAIRMLFMVEGHISAFVGEYMDVMCNIVSCSCCDGEHEK